MADREKRIADLEVTSAKATDDYVVIDGRTNGTRKMDSSILVKQTNAYSQLETRLNNFGTALDEYDYQLMEMGSEMGSITNLETEDKSSVVGAINDLKNDIGDLEDLETEDKSSLVGAINEARGSGGGSGLTADIKTALLQIASKVAYIDANGQDYYDDLYDALNAITAIRLNTNSISMQSIGATSQLTATTTPEGGTVTWTSSNISIATVDSTGLVTSVAYGSCTITAAAGSVSASCSVVVAQATVTSISATYTQSGVVCDFDSLSYLKSDLVVTATWSDSTTSTVSSSDYTLSGTLAEGTSTITVSYGGQTATFTVTVTAYDTSPSIEGTGGYKASNGALSNSESLYHTNAYEVEIDTDALKATKYYDSTNNYMNTNQTIWKVAYCIPNSNSVSTSGFGACIAVDSSDNYIGGFTETIDGSEHSNGDARYISGYFTTSDDIIGLKFTIPVADVDDSYAYWLAPASGVLPVGVSAGDIIFAGSNTAYHNKRNIND